MTTGEGLLTEQEEIFDRTGKFFTEQAEKISLNREGFWTEWGGIFDRTGIELRERGMKEGNQGQREAMSS